MLVMDFSEDLVIGELQDARLVIGLTEGYSTLGYRSFSLRTEIQVDLNTLG